MQELGLNIKIKQEKITPERELDDTDKKIDKLLELKLFEDSTSTQEDDKNNVERIKSSKEILEELFGVFNAAPPSEEDLLKKKIKKEKKKKKKDEEKKHKHKKSKKKKKSSDKDRSSDSDDNKSESPKVKKVKLEPVEVKIEKKDKEPEKPKKDSKSTEKSSVSESKKSTSKIVIKDLQNSTIFKSTTTKTSTKVKHEREHERDREREDRSRDRYKDRRHSNRNGTDKGNVESDISLSDEETYRSYMNFYKGSEYDHHSYQEFRRRQRSRSHSRDRERLERDRQERDRQERDRQDRDRFRNNEREWDRGKDRFWDRDRDRRRSRSRDRHHSRSNGRNKSRSPIDKKKLLEIARKNAITMLKSGTLPSSLTETAKEKLMAKIKHGGKTIQELTEYCRKLSSVEDFGDLSSLSGDSDHDGDGRERAFHHPFELKDRGPIVMNIKNSVPIPPKPAGQLKAILSQFPVSSGKQHQAVENEWVPVTTAPTTTTSSSSTTTTVATISKPTGPPKPEPITLQKQIEEQLPELIQSAKAQQEAPKVVPSAAPYDWRSDDHYNSGLPQIFPAGCSDNIDVSQIISQRLNAMRKLQDNPNDSEAIKVLYDTQKNMSAWATSKYTPGQFLGSTDVKVLSTKELASGYQAWAKKNQMIDTQPVTSGMGMHLLQKMGWKPGEGLGKDKSGALQPLLLEVKLDKRGLEANEELLKQQHGPKVPKAKGRGAPMPRMTLEGKHPVSLLHELSAKRRWGVPSYEVASESGPAHAKCFIFKVRVNGMEYTCPTGCNNKKEAKASVAKFCLQQLGVLP